MPYTRTISAADQGRLDEFADLLLGCRDAFLRIVEDYRWEPASSSRAAADAAELAPTGGRHELIGEAVAAYLELAVHHGGGLAGLYLSGEVFASPDQLARSIVESSARAVWILGYDSLTTTALDRLARAFIDNDMSNEEEQKVDQWLHGKSSAAYANSKRKFKILRNEIKTRFPGDSDFSTGRTIHNQDQGSLTGTVTKFFETARTLGGASIDAKVAEGIYSALSNGTHPTLYPLRRRRRPVSLAPGYIDTTLVVDVQYIEWLTKIAVVAVYIALSCVHDYIGQDFDPDSRFTDLIDSVLPGAILPPAT
ncbi:hypothetical protein ACFW9U_23190 [Rhodococcus aetherivorans]|uniref:hypothetical protein n=1 Tax=Rhodococcus aetherivorans TaxID=191292 RepID=UPI00366DE9DF